MIGLTIVLHISRVKRAFSIFSTLQIKSLWTILRCFLLTEFSSSLKSLILWCLDLLQCCSSLCPIRFVMKFLSSTPELTSRNVLKSVLCPIATLLRKRSVSCTPFLSVDLLLFCLSWRGLALPAGGVQVLSYQVAHFSSFCVFPANSHFQICILVNLRKYFFPANVPVISRLFCLV